MLTVWIAGAIGFVLGAVIVPPLMWWRFREPAPRAPDLSRATADEWLSDI